MTRIDDYCMDRFAIRPFFCLTMACVLGASAYISVSAVAWFFSTISQGMLYAAR